MSVTYISVELRRLAMRRANHLCEYCLVHADDTYWGCQIDHIISEKHGGETEAHNLAHACSLCNRNKGSDVGSVTSTGEFVRFFNPRTDLWSDHFSVDGIKIVPLTDVGEVTARILGFNHMDRLFERQELHLIGRYPSPDALHMIMR